jgi:hypothetical protein
MLKHAFKEWAVICKALALGRQALILRKGGIAERGGAFEVEHKRFWLFPTYAHQHETGIKDEAVPLLKQAVTERPPAGIIRLSHFAEVAGVYQLCDMVGVMRVRELHLWSDETIAARFFYKQPGLYLLPVRVYQAAQVRELPDTTYYADCRSWVELEQELPDADCKPVLEQTDFDKLLLSLHDLLEPTALA